MPRTLRILVADDYRDGGETLGMVLRNEGYNVQIVADGHAAIQAAQNFAPDVVILDLMMPRFDGFETAKALLRQPTSKDAVIIAYTGLTSPEIMVRCKQVGFQHFVRKPADIGQFERLLADIAAQRKSETVST